MKIIGVIPARYKSSRFEGKPLADILGKPMIWWVYQLAKKVDEMDEVYVATDDERIKNVCENSGMNVIMTSENHKTGTDRVAEVATKIEADLYVVIMGDEPAIDYKHIRDLISKIKEDKNAYAAMLVTKFKNPVDVVNSTTIKLAINNNNELIYMSRSPIPYPKARLDYDYYKNIGAYIFRKEGLEFFRKTPVGYLESIEEIELYRMLENHKIVKTLTVDSDSMSVDTPKDLERVTEYLRKKVK